MAAEVNVPVDLKVGFFPECLLTDLTTVGLVMDGLLMVEKLAHCHEHSLASLAVVEDFDSTSFLGA